MKACSVPLRSQWKALCVCVKAALCTVSKLCFRSCTQANIKDYYTSFAFTHTHTHLDVLCDINNLTIPLFP